MVLPLIHVITSNASVIFFRTVFEISLNSSMPVMKSLRSDYNLFSCKSTIALMFFLLKDTQKVSVTAIAE